MRLFSLISLLSLVLMAGCVNGTNDTADPMPGLPYYYSEFKDVAIPREMSVEQKETFITFSSDGVKLGIELVSGRVDLASLVEAMRAYMQRDGWALRSVFRSSRSILIFEKADRLCSLYIGEGTFNTNMLIFVSGKLGDGAVEYTVPQSTSTEPMLPSDPPITSQSAPANDPNVTVYPANSF